MPTPIDFPAVSLHDVDEWNSDDSALWIGYHRACRHICLQHQSPSCRNPGLRSASHHKNQHNFKIERTLLTNLRFSLSLAVIVVVT